MNNSRLQKGCRKRELGCGPHARFSKKLQFRVLFLHFTLKIKPLAEQISPEAASSEGLLPLAVKSLLISVPRLCLCFTAANTERFGFVHPRLAQTNQGQRGAKQPAGSEKKVVYILFYTSLGYFNIFWTLTKTGKAPFFANLGGSAELLISDLRVRKGPGSVAPLGRGSDRDRSLCLQIPLWKWI